MTHGARNRTQFWRKYQALAVKRGLAWSVWLRAALKNLRRQQEQSERGPEHPIDLSMFKVSTNSH